MLLEVAKERQQGEENQEGKKQWNGRGRGGDAQLCRQRMKNVNSFLNMTKQWQRQAAVFVVGRRGGEGGNEGEMM